MTLVRFDPFRELSGFSDAFGRFFDPASPAGEQRFRPAVDVLEREDRLVVTAELPGMNKEDIEIRVEEDQLILSGERKREQDVTEAGYHRTERVYGRFQRTFLLPTGVDTTAVTATYRDGLLQITLPKAEEAKPRKIAIDAA